MSATLPLLQLMTGKRARPRKAPLTAPKESVLHIAVANTLRDHALPEWQWTHVPSGELRDMRTAVKLKRMGVRRGWPDFILLPPTGQLHCLELKRQGASLTEEQEAFQLWSIRFGLPHSIADTFDQALAVLSAWGVLRGIGGRAGWALINSVRDRCYDLFTYDEKLRLHNLVCMFKSTRAISPNDRQWLQESADSLRAMGAPAARTVRRRPAWLKRKRAANG